MAEQNNYFLNKNYKSNLVSNTADGDHKNFWNEKNIRISQAAQYYVYKTAYHLARYNKIDTVLDIGCGIATQLFHFFGKKFKIYGVDQPSAVEICKKKSGGTFVADNLEAPSYELKTYLSVSPLIICADVIEHLENPDHVLNYIKRFSDKDTIIVLSTPEREHLLGKNSISPYNFYHVREWSFDEFHSYILHSGFEILTHKIIFSNKINSDWVDTFRWFWSKIKSGLPIKHTQLIIAKIKM